MKFRKLVLAGMISTACLSLCSVTASAAETDRISLTETKQAQAEAAIEAFCADICSATSYSALSENSTSTSNPYGYRVDEGFIMQSTSYYNKNYGKITETLDLSHAISVLSTSYYVVPYSNEDCCGVYVLREKDGTLEYWYQTIEEEEISNSFVKYETEIQNTINANFESDDIVSVRYLSDSLLRIDAVEIQTNTETYVIPYFQGASHLYSGITEGALYKESDFEYWASTSFEKSPVRDEEGNILFGTGMNFVGGTEITAVTPECSVEVSPWVWVGISGTVLVLTGIWWVSQHSKKAVLHPSN